MVSTGLTSDPPFFTETADPPWHARRQLQLKRLLPLRGRLHGLFGPGFATPPRALLRQKGGGGTRTSPSRPKKSSMARGQGGAWRGGLERGQCCPREHAQATQCVHVRVATSGNLANQASIMCDAISDSLRSVSTEDGASCERASLTIRPSATRCQGRPNAIKRARSSRKSAAPCWPSAVVAPDGRGSRLQKSSEGMPMPWHISPVMNCDPTRAPRPRPRPAALPSLLCTPEPTSNPPPPRQPP